MIVAYKFDSILSRVPYSDALRGMAVGVSIVAGQQQKIMVRPACSSDIPGQLPELWRVATTGLSVFIAPMTDAQYAGSETPLSDYSSVIAAGDAGYGVKLIESFGGVSPLFTFKTGFGDSFANKRIAKKEAFAKVLYNSNSPSVLGSSHGTIADGVVNPSTPQDGYEYYWCVDFSLSWPEDGSVNQGIKQFNLVFVINQV